MEFINILTFISGLLIIFVLCRIFILPLKFIFKLFLNSFLGAILILLINLGIPGAVLLTIIQLLIL